MPLYLGTKNGIPVVRPNPSLDDVQHQMLNGASQNDKLLIEGYPDDGRVPMFNWYYDWEVASWVKAA